MHVMSCHGHKETHHVSPSELLLNDILKLGGLSVCPIPALYTGQFSDRLINVKQRTGNSAIPTLKYSSPAYSGVSSTMHGCQEIVWGIWLV